MASAGDVNGDGFVDVIIGAPQADPHGTWSGASYVVFGKASGFAADINLSTLNGRNGFKLSGGETVVDESGRSVASAGDVNGDGFADVIIGARGVDTNGVNSGASYVVFGKRSRFAANIDLSTLDGSNGFKLTGVAARDATGRSVASAGDVNGDGFGDLIVSAPVTYSGSSSGMSYVIYGRAPDAAVTRVGAAAAQTLVGGAFNDALSGLGGDDMLLGNDGSDTLEGGAGNDMLDGGIGNDRLIGGTGIDAVRYALAGAGVTVRLAFAGAQDTGGAGIDTLNAIENVVGTAFDDILLGSSLDNRLEGLAGNDELRGVDGDDRLEGGAGSDRLLGSLGNDRLEGGVGHDELDGGAGADVMVGGNGNDTYIVENALDVVEETGTGFDTISTSVSFTLNAGQSIEFLDGRGAGDLTLRGNELCNIIWGGAGDDRLVGGLGDDTLRGNDGDDTLLGGGGNDLLKGGDGADLFHYRLGDGNDRFNDFSGAGGDQVALVNVTISQLVNNIATLSDGSVLTAQSGYAWAESDFVLV